MLFGVDVQHEVDQGALEPGTGAGVDRPAGARDLGAALQVEHSQRLGDFPMWAACPGLTVCGGLPGQQFTPGANHLVGGCVADRNIRVRRIRDAQEQLLEGRLRGRKIRVQLLDLNAGVGGGALEIRHFRAVGRGAGADGLADLLGGGIALRLEPIRLAEQSPTLALQNQSLIDDRRVLALVDRALTDPIRLLAQPRQPDAHASLTPVVSSGGPGRIAVEFSRASGTPAAASSVGQSMVFGSTPTRHL